MLQVKMFAASYGDAFLIKEVNKNGFAVLIDGGFASTFDKEIRSELTALAKDGHVLDLVVATHIDSDHISGLIKFFEENGSSASPKIIQVSQVWHNSLRSIPPPVITARRELSSDDKQLISDIQKQGFALSNESSSTDEEIGARQGSSLAALLLKGGYAWNESEGKNAIDTSSREFALSLTSSLKVLGPKPERLMALREQWVNELRRFGLVGNVLEGGEFDDAFEFLSAADKSSLHTTLTEIGHTRSDGKTLEEAFVPDESLNNGSSIAIAIETPTSNILFLGDSWAQDIEEAIEARAQHSFPLIFDAIKVSHHGSMRNTSCKLLGLIDAPIYLISTNGAKHNHPDLPVMREIVDRPSTFIRHLHFSYSTMESQQMVNYNSKSGAPFIVHQDSNNWIDIGNK